MPDPTDAELDEKIRLCEEYGLWPDELRLAKALRACRLQCEAHRRCTRDAMAMADAAEEQSKAKDAVIAAAGLIDVGVVVSKLYDMAKREPGPWAKPHIDALYSLENKLAALDKKTDD